MTAPSTTGSWIEPVDSKYFAVYKSRTRMVLGTGERVFDFIIKYCGGYPWLSSMKSKPSNVVFN